MAILQRLTEVDGKRCHISCKEEYVKNRDKMKGLGRIS